MPYQNPVYNHSSPDPFVLKYCGEYWGYFTGFQPDGGVFGIVRSRDLVSWQPVGSAMPPVFPAATCYWAPEVTYHNGVFYMYYSVGDEATMHIRVATAAHPAGPFVDSGHQLTHETFAIDAHVFTDDDGARYLFYATDFLDYSHVGTGTVYDRMLDWYTPEGQPRPVTRAAYDWQVYDPQRENKGGVRWHTVEGSFVLKRKGVYYHMFSGGNWQNPTYGVSYATTRDIATPDEWAQTADGEATLPILRTIPGVVVGPGHNSVVRGPDNRQLFCVYHRWDAERGTDQMVRDLAIDPLDWAGERMLVLGPSTEPQPAPNPPTFADFFEGDGALGSQWSVQRGQWAQSNQSLVQSDTIGDTEASFLVADTDFVAEVSLKLLSAPNEHTVYGVELWPEVEIVSDELRCFIIPAQNKAVAVCHGRDLGELQLPSDFDYAAFHLLRLEVNGEQVSVMLDEYATSWRGKLDIGDNRVALITRSASVAYVGFSLTLGFEDDFVDSGAPAEFSWKPTDEGWHIADGELRYTGDEPQATITKGPWHKAYELVVNARLVEQRESDGGYGIYAATRTGDAGPLITIVRDGEQWALRCYNGSDEQRFTLPASFDPTSYQQLRFRKQHGRLSIHWEAYHVGEVDVTSEPTQVGLYAHRAQIAFDMVRVTALT